MELKEKVKLLNQLKSMKNIWINTNSYICTNYKNCMSCPLSPNKLCSKITSLIKEAIEKIENSLPKTCKNCGQRIKED